MTNKLKKVITVGTAIVTVLAISPMSVLAADVDLENGLAPQFDDIPKITPQGVLRFLINGLLIVAGLIAFFYLLIGGVQWILAGGDKEGTEKARKKITNALVGLAIVFSAYALAFLINTIFGVNVLNFDIPKIVG